ncbi:glycosyltransferase family 4 protein [Synechococcus sp. CS-1328]|uniref:glycosyltransferase family 4 protein n=1 Tax=Synechococcus sp. CS-1328 TaxID=2847976 RepID=UPI00223C2C4D|nr:glycosyltransferase family 4 protein [Synechococcus sp. CS-1328]MCT0225924.1 glycosyltransferase family 4 protein [Synechococcus sp. CS-1328]
MSTPRALISTIQPFSGGVPAKTRWVVSELARIGISSLVAWYEPWSRAHRLSVPLHRVLSGARPGAVDRRPWNGVPGAGIGCWLPELEFTHYLPGHHWQKLIAGADLHLAVTGNPLCAHRFLPFGVPFLAWIGTPWHDDRVDRVRRFPWPRRLLDAAVNGPVLRAMERRVLRAPQGRILTISRHTAAALEALAGRAPAGVLLLPPDPTLFRPDPAARVPWRIGFAGRYGDPRKQLPLLLDAVALLSRQGQPVQLELTGEDDATFLHPALAARGIADRVHCYPYQSRDQLASVLRRWDLFVIPSHQEGLCIAAVEAMACGVPVVSTRCGGPEDFVLPGRTGALVCHEPAALAEAIAAICGHPERRQRLSEGALAWIADNANPAAARHRFRAHLAAVYPGLID